jgi:hypothetical protein
MELPSQLESLKVRKVPDLRDFPGCSVAPTLKAFQSKVIDSIRSSSRLGRRACPDLTLAGSPGLNRV